MEKNYLSKHAVDRVYERTYFNEKSILELINTKSYFLLGKEVDSDISHCLVYQKNTNDFFVVVRNGFNNKVITILPLEYHNKFEDRLEKNYIEIDSEIKRRAKLSAGSSLTCDELGLKIKLKVVVLKNTGLKKTYEIKVMKFSANEYLKLTSCPKKAINILNNWLKKHKDVKVLELSLSTGRESKPFLYNIFEFTPEVFVDR